MRRQVGSCASSAAISAGVDGTFALWMTAPFRPMTQICVSAIDTSSPAKYSMLILLFHDRADPIGFSAQHRMIDRTQERFGLWPERLAADAAYGSAENLAWLVHERAIEPHIPVFDKSQRTDGTFSRDDFAYDRERDCYICPAGKELRKRQKIYRVPRPLVDE